MVSTSCARGQTLVEYIFVFALFSLISIGMVNTISTYSGDSFKSFAFYLTQGLSTGVCPDKCWGTGFENGAE